MRIARFSPMGAVIWTNRLQRPAQYSAAPMAKLPRKVYKAELLRLQTELVAMTEWVRREGA
jgi:hypothetical protein